MKNQKIQQQYTLLSLIHISFLNAVLNKDKTQELVELEIINEKELTTDNIQDKKGIIDVLAKTSDGTNINIEVQLTNQDNMDKSCLLYTSRCV